MADRYFIAGGVDNNWSNIANWSAVSGGAGGETVPTSADAVYLDANSPNCVPDIAASCLSIDCAGYVNTLSQSANLDVYGNLTFVVGMTFIPNTYGVTFLASATIDSAGKGFYNFTFGATATYTLSGNIITTGTLNLMSVTVGTSTINGYAIYAQGNITFANAATLVTGTTALEINGTGAQSWIGSTSTTSLYTRVALSVTINKAAGTLTLIQTIPLEGGITFTQGDVDFGSSVVYLKHSTFIWTAGTLTVGTSNMIFAATLTIQAGFITAIGNFYKLTFSGSNTFTLEGNLTVTSTFNPAGLTETNTINNYIIYAQGDITPNNAMYLITGTSELHITGAATQTWTGSSSSTGTYHRYDIPVVINKSGGTLTFNQYVKLENNFTYTAGTVDAGTSIIGLASSAFDSSGLSWYDIIIAGNTTPTSALDVNNDLTINAGQTLTAGSNQINVARIWTNNGTFTPGTGTVVFDGTSIVAGATTFENLTFAAAATIHLTSTQTFIVSALFTAVGVLGSEITLDATTSGSQAILTVNGSENVDYANATDIDSSAGILIDELHGVLANTLNWVITAPLVGAETAQAGDIGGIGGIEEAGASDEAILGLLPEEEAQADDLAGIGGIELAGASDKVSMTVDIPALPRFPDIPSPMFPVVMTPSFDVGVIPYVDGSEQRILGVDEPQLKIGLQYKLLGPADKETILAFFVSRKGKAETFYWVNEKGVPYIVRFQEDISAVEYFAYQLWNFNQVGFVETFWRSS